LAWPRTAAHDWGFSILELHREPIPTQGLAIKRVIERCVSSFGLLMFSPLLAAAGIWDTLDSTGRRFYRAPRVGRRKRL